MVSKKVIPAALVLGALVASPSWADDGQHRRGGQEHARQQQSEPAQQRERATPRDNGGRERAQQNNSPQYEAPRQYQNNSPRYDAPRQYQNNNSPRYDAPRQYQASPRQYQAPRTYDNNRGYETAVPRQYDRRDYDRRDYDRRDYDRRDYDRRDNDWRDYGRNNYYGSRGYNLWYGRVSPRIIRPSIVTVSPYRPYVYRPSWSIGIYYGNDGYYPYGYTPRGYYDPLPGHVYGGLRITGMPRDAQVFADGYYVGLVDDFDGIFQHLNLEAGPHHIEVGFPGGYEPPVAFDVVIQPGQTVTYRAY